ncbi:MAG: ABC transporter substrate-binding protein, partial [Chloroflexi bacterium]|nr:ABC transporter substrate-binding protein [Chloroflexota bacterium]
GRLAPGVVEKWEIAPDGLSWTFQVRKGVKFHDGSDLTGKDVKFSIERYMGKDAIMANVRNAVQRVELVDNYTVRVFTNSPSPFLPSSMSDPTPSQGLVMPMDYINKNGLDYFMKNPNGSGPWKMTKYVPADSVQYTANENYWLRVPAFKTLTVVVVPDPATRVVMLKAGDLDVTNVSLDDTVALEKAGYTTYSLLAAQGAFLFHGTYDPRAKGLPTSDVRVREALQIAINQDEISKTLFYGKALPIMPPRVLYGQEGVDSDYWVKYMKDLYKFDPARAKELLKQAGYPNGFSGLKIHVFVQAGMEYVSKLAESVQFYWRQIGANAEILPIDAANLVRWRAEPADPLVGQITSLQTAYISPVVSNLESIYGSKSVYRLGGRKTETATEVYTPDLDKVVYAALSEIDAKKRQDLTAQMIKMALDTRTAISFGQVPAVIAVGPKVKFNLKQPLEVSFPTQFADMAEHR